MQHTKCYKRDYPRPQFVRDNWINLNGSWDFAFDRDDSGESKGYQNGFEAQKKINVPFAYQCAASGIGNAEMCQNIWYKRTFVMDDIGLNRLLLHFEGSDYLTKVWVNGKYCGSEVGGYHRLTFDITSAAVQGNNTLVVKVFDSYSREQPRGKQRAEDHDYGCWYVDTSGIYKTVWLEVVPQTYLSEVKLTPNLESKGLEIRFTLNQPYKNAVVAACAYWQGKAVGETLIDVCDTCGYGFLSLDEVNLWQVGQGGLYDLKLQLKADDKVVDEAESYFGMREICIRDGKILLNGKPLYQRLVLDQGYWENCDLTPPDEDALKKDLTDCMAMGFNGCRKHEKVEDERFLYYADVYGYIVWAEMPSVYAFTEVSRETLLTEWKKVVAAQYNHPCVLTWVAFNESWGVEQIKSDLRQQRFVNQVYLATKEIDAMRPVICNDGWEHTLSDILTLHDYTQDGKLLHESFNTVEKCTQKIIPDNKKQPFVDGYSYRGQPIMITEFGGTSFIKDTNGNRWGYGTAVQDDEEYLSRIGGMVKGIVDIPFICGFCYTQVSNVYHEVNGLLEFDRTSKESFEKYRKVFDLTLPE